jgi:putative ABC transport system permease protein
MTRRGRREDELREEIETHLRMATADRIDSGTPPNDAAAAARREFGNISHVQEATRDVWGRRWLEALGQDLRYALRTFNRNRSFASVAIVSLALGIGANLALFQVVNAVRLRSLPVASPQTLADIHIVNMDAARGSRQMWFPAVTFPIFREIEQRQEAFSEVFAWSSGAFNLATGGEMRLANGLFVTGHFFNALGLQPAAGRLLTPDDDREGCAPQAVLSHAYWLRMYGGQPSALGQTITLNARAIDIIGIAPEGFRGLEVGNDFDVAIPVCAEGTLSDNGRGRLASGTTWWLGVFGRLKPEWTLERASAHLQTISPGIFGSTVATNYPAESVGAYQQFTLAAYPGGAGLSDIRETYETPLWLLLGTAGVVLLIACANLANLLLARATARQREIAVRLSLGASRARIVRQLITESVLLAVLGGVAGALLARWLSDALVTFLNTTTRTVTLPLAFDWRIAAFAFGLVLATAALFGVTPALRATRVDADSVVRGTGRGLTSSREALGLRRMLVVAQIALALVLLFGCLLFVRSLRNLSNVDPGFRSGGVVIANIQFNRVAMPPERRPEFRRELMERILALPGIEAAGAVQNPPLSGGRTSNRVWLESNRGQAVTSRFNTVGPGYFATLRIPLMSGREFDERDGPTAEQTAIVDEHFVATVLQGQPAIGTRFSRERTPATPEMTYRIVGVVRGSTYGSLREDAEPTIYLADAQSGNTSFLRLAVRSSLPADTVTASITRAMAAIDSTIGLRYSIMAGDIRNTLVLERLMATLSTGFGLLAVVLTLVGLYGVIAYTVARRTNEIGVRMALGANAATIVRLVVRETGVMLIAGLVIGVGLALAAGRQAAALLFDVPPYDPWLLLAAVGLLGVIAIVASAAPARRATKIQPIVALRTD